ncbi:uncharacterized protein LOC113591517 isoform X2 [Electrophorus electricus]|uniref:uncharacterized protein LOC113591517 isoform X2 n=1 Tax=Electrophorus electricus TaxID=8005 RepID=UPI0015CFCCAE|nr:uncharacterized protein LOC113591517 isoform X2 [Electrophorus electricus]
MERLGFSVVWCGAILFTSSLLSGHTGVQAVFKMHKLCRFCDFRPSTCNATGICLSNCTINSICEVQDEVCVAAWHRENMTVETVCHDPSLPFHGVMLDDYNNTKCVMKQYKALDPHFYICSCTTDECNDELIFTPHEHTRQGAVDSYSRSEVTVKEAEALPASAVQCELQLLKLQLEAENNKASLRDELIAILKRDNDYLHKELQQKDKFVRELAKGTKNWRYIPSGVSTQTSRRRASDAEASSFSATQSSLSDPSLEDCQKKQRILKRRVALHISQAQMHGPESS